MAEVIKSDTFSVENAITIIQFPKIEERLKEISGEFETRISEALALECNEDTIKSIKSVRADINRAFENLESMRKNVKSAVMKPYDDIETIYRSLISDKYNAGINTLSSRITEVENELRARREKELGGYFSEYKQTCCPDAEFLTLARTGVKVNLSCSMKSLKDAVKKFVDGVRDDLAAIELYETHAEILVEYKRTLSLAQAIQTVEQRRRAIEEQRVRTERIRIEREAREQARKEQDRLLVEKPDNVIPLPVHPEPLAPPVITRETPVPEPDSQKQEAESGGEQLFTLTFTVTATKTKLRALKQFLSEGEYQIINGRSQTA